MIYHGGKHYKTFQDLESVARKATKKLRPILDEFDSIIVTGVSGMAVGFPVALRLKKPIIVLRKEDDQTTHSYDRMEGRGDLGKRVLFLDDFVSGGNTHARVRAEVEKAGAKLAGTYQYRTDKLELGPRATHYSVKVD